jgi:hypothetical protein
MNLCDESIPTRDNLLTWLKDWSDDESWGVFFDTYWRLIYSAAIKSGFDACRGAGCGTGDRHRSSQEDGRF